MDNTFVENINVRRFTYVDMHIIRIVPIILKFQRQAFFLSIDGMSVLSSRILLGKVHIFYHIS